MDTTRLSRRDMMRLTTVGGVSVLAATGRATGAAAQDVTLTIWAQDWGTLYNKPMVELSDAFTADVAPNITVEWTFMPNVIQKLVASIAAGNPPDIAMVNDHEVPQLAAVESLNALDTYFEENGISKEGFIPFTWDSVIHEEMPYAIPGGVGALCLMYDKAVFREVGIDPDSLPDTPSWDQFVEWNKMLVKRDDNGGISRVGLVPDSGGFAQYAGVLGATYYNAEATQLTVNSPETVAALEKWAGLLPEGFSYDQVSTLMSTASSDPQGDLAGGVVGFQQDGYWVFSAFDTYWPDLDYGIMKLPTPNGIQEEWSLYTGWAWHMAIPKGAEHPDEAWSFLKYGFWENAAMLADTLNWTCVLDEFDPFLERTGQLMGLENRMQPYLHHFAEAQYDAEYFVPNTAIAAKLKDAMAQAVDQVLRGERGAQEALDEVVAQLQPELDRSVAERAG